MRDHLENGDGKKPEKATKDEKGGKKEGESDDKEDLKDDYQLNEALNLLKGVNIANKLR